MRHLDTNIMIAYLNGDGNIANKIKIHSPDVEISSLVLAELLYGARASNRKESNIEKIYKFLQIVAPVDFDQKCAEAYGEIRASLRQKGRPVGEMDLLIGSIAVANNAILVTHNTRHFQHIDGLVLEDWLKD